MRISTVTMYEQSLSALNRQQGEFTRVGQQIFFHITDLESFQIKHQQGGNGWHGNPDYSVMVTAVPTGTWSKTRITSALRIRMQPWEAGEPMGSLSGVP